MCFVVQCYYDLCIGQIVEGQCVGYVDDMFVIDQMVVVFVEGGIEMYFGGVLLQVGGQYMFGFFDGDGIYMVDYFVYGIVVVVIGFFGQLIIVIVEIQFFGDDQLVWIYGVGQIWNYWVGCGCIGIGFVYYDLVYIFQYWQIYLVDVVCVYLDYV